VIRKVKNLLSLPLEFLYPPICTVCESKLAEDGICEGCWEDLLEKLLDKPKLYFGFKVFSLFLYEGKVRRAIERMKYSNMRTLATKFAGFLAEYLKDEGLDLVVPVPLHPARRRERGFSQTRLIGKVLAHELGLPMRFVLFRNRYTSPQALLGASERASNLRGAFSYKECLNGESVLLVDDVITTGYTFYEAASELLKAGASRVVGGTLARGSV